MTKQEAQREFDFVAGRFNRARRAETTFTDLREWGNALDQTNRKTEAMFAMRDLLNEYPDLDQSKVK